MSELELQLPPMSEELLLEELGDLSDSVDDAALDEFTANRIEQDSQEVFKNLTKEKRIVTMLVDKLVSKYGKKEVINFLTSLPGYEVGLHDLKNASTLYFSYAKDN